MKFNDLVNYTLSENFDRHVQFLMEMYLKSSSNDLANLKQLQQNVFNWWLNFPDSNFSYQDWNQIQSLFLPIKQQAYDMLLEFHQKELMIAKLTQYYYVNDQQNVIERLKSDIRGIFPWLREFLKAMLLSRLGGLIYSRDSHDNFKQRVFRVEDFVNLCKSELHKDANLEVWHADGGTVPWSSMLIAYVLLEDASNFSEKIKAVSLALNACHDNGRIFDQWLGIYTEKEFEQLSNINEREVDRKINQLLSKSTDFTIY